MKPCYFLLTWLVKLRWLSQSPHLFCEDLSDVKCNKTILLFLLSGWLVEFQEIQKIVVFEGAFDKIFSIIKEEGGSEGGVVVQVIPL